MTIRPDDKPLPGDVGDLSSGDGERRAPVTSLAEEILSTWEKTFRAVFVIVVLLAVIIVGLWLLPIDLHIGPVQITHK
jgi:hypothetical protein